MPLLHVQIESRDTTHSSIVRPTNRNDKIDKLLKSLQKQKLHYQLTGQYDLAELTMKKMENLKQRTAEKSHQKLQNNNVKKKRRMQAQQTSILNQFEKDWNKRIKKFDSNAQRTLTELHESQEQELRKFADNMRNQLRRSKIKFSPDCLSLRETEYALARQNRFDQAKIVQKNKLKLESQEQLQFRRNLDKKFNTMMDKKKIEQRKAFQSLNDRLSNSHKELVREYRNQKHQLFLRHKAMLAHFDINQKKNTQQEIQTTKNKLQTTYVGTCVNHAGTVSPKRPWTFTMTGNENSNVHFNSQPNTQRKLKTKKKKVSKNKKRKAVTPQRPLSNTSRNINKLLKMHFQSSNTNSEVVSNRESEEEASTSYVMVSEKQESNVNSVKNQRQFNDALIQNSKSRSPQQVKTTQTDTENKSQKKHRRTSLDEIDSQLLSLYESEKNLQNEIKHVHVHDKQQEEEQAEAEFEDSSSASTKPNIRSKPSLTSLKSRLSDKSLGSNSKSTPMNLTEIAKLANQEDFSDAIDKSSQQVHNISVDLESSSFEEESASSVNAVESDSDSNVNVNKLKQDQQPMVKQNNTNFQQANRILSPVGGITVPPGSVTATLTPALPDLTADATIFESTSQPFSDKIYDHQSPKMNERESKASTASTMYHSVDGVDNESVSTNRNLSLPQNSISRQNTDVAMQLGSHSGDFISSIDTKSEDASNTFYQVSAKSKTQIKHFQLISSKNSVSSRHSSSSHNFKPKRDESMSSDLRESDIIYQPHK